VWSRCDTKRESADMLLPTARVVVLVFHFW
jgi:hypothetical protein